LNLVIINIVELTFFRPMATSKLWARSARSELK